MIAGYRIIEGNELETYFHFMDVDDIRNAINETSNREGFKEIKWATGQRLIAEERYPKIIWGIQYLHYLQYLYKIDNELTKKFIETIVKHEKMHKKPEIKPMWDVDFESLPNFHLANYMNAKESQANLGACSTYENPLDYIKIFLKGMFIKEYIANHSLSPKDIRKYLLEYLSDNFYWLRKEIGKSLTEEVINELKEHYTKLISCID